MNEETFKIYFKQKGTEFNKDIPLIKSEMFFDSSNTVERVMKAIHHHVDRKKWDLDMEVGEIMQVIN